MAYTTTKTPHVHAELIKAWADGAEIEYWYAYANRWEILINPSWCNYQKYRIKPVEYPKTTLPGSELSNVFHKHVESSFQAVANEAIKHFITSGQMEEWLAGQT